MSYIYRQKKILQNIQNFSKRKYKQIGGLLDKYKSQIFIFVAFTIIIFLAPCLLRSRMEFTDELEEVTLEQLEPVNEEIDLINEPNTEKTYENTPVLNTPNTEKTYENTQLLNTPNTAKTYENTPVLKTPNTAKTYENTPLLNTPNTEKTYENTSLLNTPSNNFEILKNFQIQDTNKIISVKEKINDYSNQPKFSPGQFN